MSCLSLTKGEKTRKTPLKTNASLHSSKK